MYFGHRAYRPGRFASMRDTPKFITIIPSFFFPLQAEQPVQRGEYILSRRIICNQFHARNSLGVGYRCRKVGGGGRGAFVGSRDGQPPEGSYSSPDFQKTAVLGGREGIAGK